MKDMIDEKNQVKIISWHCPFNIHLFGVCSISSLPIHQQGVTNNQKTKNVIKFNQDFLFEHILNYIILYWSKEDFLKNANFALKWLFLPKKLVLERSCEHLSYQQLLNTCFLLSIKMWKMSVGFCITFIGLLTQRYVYRADPTRKRDNVLITCSARSLQKKLFFASCRADFCWGLHPQCKCMFDLKIFF